MATSVLPPRFPLSEDQLNSKNLPDSSIYIRIKHSQLQKQAEFKAIEQSLRVLFENYQLAEQRELPPTDAERAALILAWQDYCRDMLAFVQYCRQTIKREGSETTYLIGQAYLKALMAPYAKLVGHEFAQTNDDSQLLIQQLIFQPGNVEILVMDKLLKALEKYYKTNQTLINQLNTFTKLAKKLADVDFRENNREANHALLTNFNEDFRAYQDTLVQLQQTRHQLKKQVQHFEKRFAVFLLGPIFKFFWGKEQKMCRLVMQTVDNRIQHISEETAHHLSAHGSRYLSYIKDGQHHDGFSGPKLLRLNNALIDLSKQNPCTEIINARQQLRSASIRVIDVNKQAKATALTAMSQYLGACLQDVLHLDEDHRHTISENRQIAEETASDLLDGYATSNVVAANQRLSRRNANERGQRYRRTQDELAYIRDWKKDCDIESVIACDTSVPQSNALTLEFTRTLCADQCLHVPVEKLVCIRRFGHINQRNALTTIIDGYLSTYLNYETPHDEGQRLLAVIFRAGTQQHQLSLQDFFKQWNSSSLFTVADDKAELEKMVITILNAKKYACENGQDQLAAHCQQAVTHLPELAFHILTESQGQDPQTEARLRNIIDVFLHPKLAYSYGHLILDIVACRELWHGNKINHQQAVWQLLPPLISLLNSLPTPHTQASQKCLSEFTKANKKCIEYCQALAETNNITMLHRLESFHRTNLLAMVQYGVDETVPDEKHGVSGYFLWQAFNHRWQDYIDVNNQEPAALENAIDVCLQYLNELLKQNNADTPDFIYPQAKQVVAHLLALQKVCEPKPYDQNTPDKTEHCINERKLGFLEVTLDEAATYPELAQLAVWHQAVQQVQEGEVHNALRATALDKLQSFYLWLSNIDFFQPQPFTNAPPVYMPEQDNHLFYALWHGLVETQDKSYHQAALQVTHALINAARHYLDGYEAQPQVDRWSLAHIPPMKFIMTFITGLQVCHEQIPNTATVKKLHALHEQYQRVNQQALLISLFRDIVPDAWREQQSDFAGYYAMDAHREKLEMMSPLQKKEQQSAQSLSEQLRYLAEGKGNGQFSDLKLWRKVNERVLYETLSKVTAMSEQRKSQSANYVNELSQLQAYCEDPPAIDLPREAKLNTATQVANQLDQSLAFWVKKICNRTEEDLTALLTQDQAATNSKPSKNALRLFVQRLAFIYTLHETTQDISHPARELTEYWLKEQFNPRVTDEPEAIQKLIMNLPEKLFERLLQTKPKDVDVSTDNFWKLVNYVQKSAQANKGEQSLRMMTI